MSGDEHNMSIPRAHITGMVLAGGQGRRMGGCDKGLQVLHGLSLVEHMLQRLRPQVAGLALNANRNLATYAAFGLPVWPDQGPDFYGPLAGIESGLRHCPTPYLLCVPCDTPLLPPDLCQRLSQALVAEQADLALACTLEDGVRRWHPTCCLLPTRLLPEIQAFLQQGKRQLRACFQQWRVAEVEFAAETAFLNVNTLDQLQALATSLQVERTDSVTPSPSANADITTAPEIAPSLHAWLHSLPDYQPYAMPLANARSILQQRCRPLQEWQMLPLSQAQGRILSRDLPCPLDIPPFDNSAMDGYALHSSNLQGEEVRLQVVGTALAGHPYAGSTGAGNCVRIMTGALLPADCDTVIASEKVLASDEHSILLKADSVRAGANCRRRGEELRQGELALAAGSNLQAAQIGWLASLGIAELPVLRRLRVAFFCTGDELRPLASHLGPGQLYDSNRYSLQALLKHLGCEVIDLGVVPDQPQAIRQALQQATLQADAVLTSGGMANGDADHTRRILQEAGDIHFWQMQMRPGRPFAFGTLHAGERSAHLFGLPGNPAALMISFYMLVRPALLRLMGCTQSEPPAIPLPLAGTLRKQRGRSEFLRGKLGTGTDGRIEVSPCHAQGAAMLSGMSAANCIICLPPEQGDVQNGEQVMVMLLQGL